MDRYDDYMAEPYDTAAEAHAEYCEDVYRNCRCNNGTTGHGMWLIARANAALATVGDDAPAADFWAVVDRDEDGI